MDMHSNNTRCNTLLHASPNCFTLPQILLHIVSNCPLRSSPIHFMISRFQLKVSVVGQTIRALAAHGSPKGPCLMRV